MSGAIFQSELSSLIQDSKRKHPDVKAAAERSLSDLKAFSVTSEAQLAGDLLRKPSFVVPFVLACHSRSTKLVHSGVICLQRLTAIHALPSERLRDVLEAFREVTSSSFDVQIKILQTLPVFLQTYASDLHGNLLFTSLEICRALQGSKTGFVTSTAAATLQQLISSVFEKIADIDEVADADTVREVQIGDGTVTLTKEANDGFDVLSDLCDIADGVSAKHLKSSTISPTFVLDLIITILAGNERLFKTHSELLFICRSKLMPALVRRLSAKNTFPVTIRSLRILYLLITRHLQNFIEESETVLGLLIHFLDPEASQGWKRAACLEFLRSMISDFSLLRQVFEFYDMREERKNVVSKMLSAMAKIAAEKPTVIGLSHQSTMPARSAGEEDAIHEQVSLDAAGVEGVIGGTVTAESHMTGISSIWSLPKTPCLEQLDKNDAPSLPDTYIYSLVLTSMSSMSEGLAKFVMPMGITSADKKRTHVQAADHQKESNDEKLRPEERESVPPDFAADQQKVSKPVNTVSLTAHPQPEPMRTAMAFVTSCWPAVLATCATFLNAALDAECYHSLVRAIQKLSQSAGVLELSTPRDAFLTALAKAAVPAQVLQSVPTADSRKAEPQSAVQSATSTDAGSTLASPAGKPAGENHTSAKADVSSLTTRNLLCLRALLNLGIALGPTLSQEAWFILLETLQEAEKIIHMSSRLLTNQSGKRAADKVSDEPSDSGDRLAGEIAAVQAASKKMFASTSSYDNEVFLNLLKALLSLSLSTQSAHVRKGIASPVESPTHGRVGRMHQSSRSASGSSFRAAVEDDQVLFVLSKTSEMARSNLRRFARESAADSGWSLINASLLHVIKSGNAVSEMRLHAASLLDSLALGTLTILDEENEHLRKAVQQRAVETLRHQIGGLYQQGAFSASESRKVDFDIHERVIETLISIVEQHGENLLIGWETIFEIGQSIFPNPHSPPGGELQQGVQVTPLRAKNVRLISPSFRLLQLIGSDFLNLLSMQSLLEFVETLLLFGRQHDDLNVSLTSSTFFWNLADFLQSKPNPPSLNNLPDGPEEEFLVRQVTSSEDVANAAVSLWLLLLLRLNTLTIDSRAEVRNSAIRVMLKILDASGPSLSPHGWHICLSFIVLRVLKSHDSQLVMIRESLSDAGSKHMHEWYATTVALLEGAINLVCHFVSTICADKQFSAFWGHLFELFGSILTKPSLAISLAAFRGVTLLFSALQKTGYHDASAAEAALRLWIRCHPADIPDHLEREEVSAEDQSSNQDALTAHAEMIVRSSEAFPPVEGNRIAARDILQALRKTIFRCVHPPYGSDVFKLSPEQGHVVVTLQLLSETQTSKSTEYHKTMLEFIQLAFKDEGNLENDTYLELPVKQDALFRKGKKPTFVAFASKCIDILEGDIVKMIQHETVVHHSARLRPALDVLCDTIKAKYTARAHRGDPLLWRKATASAITIIEVVSCHISDSMDQDRKLALLQTWGSAVKLADGILCSGSLKHMNPLPDRSAILADEEHDTRAFKRLSSRLVPALTRLNDPEVTSHQSITSDIHRNFAVSLFHASMIAAPQHADLPSDEDLVSSPTSSLLRVRAGTIKELVFCPRENVPYLALDTLFKLIEDFSNDERELPNAYEARVALAETAGTYVLLRAAHTIKSFIADQPLRGPMPMPSRLRSEMLYVLRSCLRLRSEDAAFAGKSGSYACLGSDGKRHLRVLHPLILRMWNVWRRVPRYGPSWITDDDGIAIENCLHQWIATCGEGWEVASVDS